ncbi:hypothetical protein E4T50_11035 [Aureobasidium sp. EXF-12298]|nr:hypothetical protein E4T50_11035 [Aureobasidium sp. EXF-12298]
MADTPLRGTGNFHEVATIVVGGQHAPDSAARGQGQTTYTIHKDLLTAESPFFSAALNGAFAEGLDQTVHLPEEKPEIFEWFLWWLYTGSLTSPTSTNCEIEPRRHRLRALDAMPGFPGHQGLPQHVTHTDGDLRNSQGSPKYFLLLDLYALSDKLMTTTLCNHIVDTIARLSESTNSVPTPSDTWILYDNIRDNAPMRKLILDLFAYKKTDKLLESHKDEWHPRFLRELVVKLKRPGLESLDRHSLTPWRPISWQKSKACEACRELLTPGISNTAAASPSLKLTSAGAPSPLRSPLGRRDSRDMASSHRQSFSDRGIPNSPRQRNPSLSQQAIQDLINNPPVGRKDDAIPKFAGRDWRSITLEEILVPDEVRFVEVDSTIEAATKLLIESGSPNVILIRESPSTRKAIGQFDYDDLNAYLLLVTGLARPQDSDFDQVDKIVSRARTNQPVELGHVKNLLGRKETPAFCDADATLARAVEIFGGGCHRIIVRAPGSEDVVGILSQLRLVRFLWENRASFQPVEQLHNRSLKELDLGSHSVISINGDRPLKDALNLMHGEGITSLPVLDNHKNVIGNISHVDIKLLTNTSALPLLDSSCIHFITVILSERGMNDGQDSYPVFHVNPTSTLAHTVAKLVATRSHRMWIVDAPSPTSSIPPSPHLGPSVTAPPPVLSQLSSSTAGPPYTPATPNVSVSASSLPGATLGGHLNGVVSLTDLLNLFARMSGLSPLDPDETRRRRRRSSSHSSMQASVDSFRSSVDIGRTGSQRR